MSASTTPKKRRVDGPTSADQSAADVDVVGVTLRYLLTKAENQVKAATGRYNSDTVDAIAKGYRLRGGNGDDLAASVAKRFMYKPPDEKIERVGLVVNGGVDDESPIHQWMDERFYELVQPLLILRTDKNGNINVASTRARFNKFWKEAVKQYPSMKSLPESVYGHLSTVAPRTDEVKTAYNSLKKDLRPESTNDCAFAANVVAFLAKLLTKDGVQLQTEHASNIGLCAYLKRLYGGELSNRGSLMEDRVDLSHASTTFTFKLKFYSETLSREYYVKYAPFNRTVEVKYDNSGDLTHYPPGMPALKPNTKTKIVNLDTSEVKTEDLFGIEKPKTYKYELTDAQYDSTEVWIACVHPDPLVCVVAFFRLVEKFILVPYADDMQYTANLSDLIKRNKGARQSLHAIMCAFGFYTDVDTTVIDFTRTRPSSVMSFKSLSRARRFNDESLRLLTGEDQESLRELTGRVLFECLQMKLVHPNQTAALNTVDRNKAQMLKLCKAFAHARFCPEIVGCLKLRTKQLVDVSGVHLEPWKLEIRDVNVGAPITTSDSLDDDDNDDDEYPTGADDMPVTKSDVAFIGKFNDVSGDLKRVLDIDDRSLSDTDIQQSIKEYNGFLSTRERAIELENKTLDTRIRATPNVAARNKIKEEYNQKI